MTAGRSIGCLRFNRYIKEAIASGVTPEIITKIELSVGEFGFAHS